MDCLQCGNLDRRFWLEVPQLFQRKDFGLVGECLVLVSCQLVFLVVVSPFGEFFHPRVQVCHGVDVGEGGRCIRVFHCKNPHEVDGVQGGFHFQGHADFLSDVLPSVSCAATHNHRSWCAFYNSDDFYLLLRQFLWRHGVWRRWGGDEVIHVIVCVRVFLVLETLVVGLSPPDILVVVVGILSAALLGGG